ncbi:MAG: response regulator [Isosphaeraceae bacterium]
MTPEPNGAQGTEMTRPLKHTLLVVDDEPDVCDSVHDLLRRDFRVLRASSAQEGFRLIQEEEVHIIMTDQRMPRITGVELLAKVKMRNPHAVRLLFTGYTDVESVIAAINQGHIFHFLKKPWQPEELMEAVREAADEYDRILARAEERTRLRAEISDLQHRVDLLEGEVKRLQSAKDRPAPGPRP